MTRGFQEKRKFTRHKVCSSGQLEMFDGSFQISVEDMSIGGLKIRSAISLAPETYVAIRIDTHRFTKLQYFSDECFTVGVYRH